MTTRVIGLECHQSQVQLTTTRRRKGSGREGKEVHTGKQKQRHRKGGGLLEPWRYKWMTAHISPIDKQIWLCSFMLYLYYFATVYHLGLIYVALLCQTNGALINIKLIFFNLHCQYVIYKQCNLNMKSVNKSLLNQTDIFLIITRSL